MIGWLKIFKRNSTNLINLNQERPATQPRRFFYLKYFIRTKYFYTYIYFMKTKVNLTIEKSVLEKAKAYAEEINESLSGIVEDYLKTLSKTKKESFVDYIDKLEVPKPPADLDFKQEYYSEKAKKYGI